MSRLSPVERLETKSEVTIIGVNAPLYTHSCGELHPELWRRAGADKILDIDIGLDAVPVPVDPSADLPLPLRERLPGDESVLATRH